jgi:hypothetical protein
MPKNCYLTDKGFKKVEEALEKLVQGEADCRVLHKNQKIFPENVNLLQLEITVRIGRETLKKVLSKQGGVNHKTLEDLFTAIFIEEIEEGIDYEYEIPQEQIDPPQPNNNEPLVKIIVAQNGIPFIVRRNT